MFQRTAAALAAIFCLFSLTVPAMAAEVDCDSVYCFSGEDFSGEEEKMTGICLTELPKASLGTLKLGPRVLRAGDILTQEQAAQMTFCPLSTTQDAEATFQYLPIYENRVEKAAEMTISIRGKEDKAPVAMDCAVETYKNLPNTQKLKASDPEGQKLSYTVTRQPRRGQVTIHEDGSFTYAPKKNKVGVDSFTYTAADPAGNVSREATVTITILKPTQSTLYTDTVGQDCRFEAEWMKNTGIFTGENLVGSVCFQPEKAVTRGEFITMLVNALGIPVEDTAAGNWGDAPKWLKPYLSAAMRSGLTEGLPGLETFDLNQPITGAEAAVMVNNALDYACGDAAAFAGDVPDWAADSVSALAEQGIALQDGALSRGDVAKLLYQVSGRMDEAPGMVVIRANRE